MLHIPKQKKKKKNTLVTFILNFVKSVVENRAAFAHVRPRLESNEEFNIQVNYYSHLKCRGLDVNAISQDWVVDDPAAVAGELASKFSIDYNSVLKLAYQSQMDSTI